MKSILRSTTRNLITSSRRFENLKTTEEIRNFLAESTWSINELLKLPTGSSQPEVSPEIVKKMLKLSGLNDLKDDQSVTKALNLQMMFINHLYDNDHETVTPSPKRNENNGIFRLLASDHLPQRPLELNNLLKQINEIKPDPSKGEVDFTISDLQRDSFVINKRKE